MVECLLADSTLKKPWICYSNQMDFDAVHWIYLCHCAKWASDGAGPLAYLAVSAGSRLEAALGILQRRSSSKPFSLGHPPRLLNLPPHTFPYPHSLRLPLNQPPALNKPMVSWPILRPTNPYRQPMVGRKAHGHGATIDCLSYWWRRPGLSF